MPSNVRKPRRVIEVGDGVEWKGMNAKCKCGHSQAAHYIGLMLCSVKGCTCIKYRDGT